MITPTTVSMIRDLVAIFGVIAGFSYYVLTVRNTNRARKTQVVLNLVNQLNEEEGNKIWVILMSMQWEDFDDFRKKYDSTVNPDHYSKRWRQWSYYNNLGYMLNQNIIDIDMVYNMIGGPSMIIFWERFKPIILEYRKLYNDPNWFGWWEYLINEIFKYREENNLNKGGLDPDEYNTEFKTPT